MEPIEQQRALALLGDVTTPPGVLAQIAGQYRESWPLVAQHPNVYPGLLDWMRQQGFVPAPVAPAPPQPSASPQPSAVAAAVPAVPAAASGPVPATEPGASAAPKTKRRPLLIAAVATVVLALVAGVAAAVGGFLPGLNPFGSGRLTVTGTPPAASGSWASGTRQVWRSTPIRQSASSSTGKGPFNAGVGPVTAQGWALGDIPGDIAVFRTGLSADDGTVLWADRYYDDCANTSVNGLVPCVTLVPEGLKLELIDWSTGTATSTTVLNDLGLGSLLPGWARVGVVDGAILVSVAGAEYFEEGLASGVETVTVARFDADGTRRAWLNTVAVCESCLQDTSWWYQQQFRVNHGIVTMYAGAALDFATGAPVFGDEVIVARPVAADVLMVKTASGRQVPATLRAPDGTTLAIVGDAASLVLQGDVPPHPLRAERGGSSLQVTAYDPANGQSRWPQPITVAQAADPYSTAYVRFDGERLLFVTTREIVAVDPESGAVLWRKTIAGVDYLSSASAADQTIFLAVHFRTSTSMASRTYALDAHTGDVLWQVDGAASVAPAPGGGESLLVEGSGSSGQIARLDPADRPESTGVPVPADAPACPDAMTPISWVQYTDGAVLVCQQDERFSVVVPNANWRAAELHFNDGGYSIVFTNGIRLTASLGGMLVSIDDRGTVTTPAVTRAWSSARGEGPFTVPAGLPACPAGSWPLSLSTFSGGWLLVCGTATPSPTSLVLYDNGQTIEGSEVTYRSGAYCAQTDGGVICAYWAPALVTREIGSGVVQHSVDHNYFAGRGSGGTGQGTGSYGVDTPTQDAQDQVRYLTQILQRSMVGRASLETAINQVRSCTNVADAVASLGDVVVNREELLDAVAAAPVDAVPNGAALVAKLRLALQRSLDTDRYWLAWAQAQAATNCSDGTSNPNYLRANEMTHGVADAKNDFLTTWNTQIAPRYRAPQFTIGQI